MRWGARKSGFQSLAAKMGDMKDLAGDDVALRALTAAGQPISTAARENVRVGTGRLRDSITVGTQLSPHQAAIVPDDGIHVYVGPGPEPEAIIEEFGDAREAPHPFLRPAWDAQQSAAFEAATDVYAAECARLVGS